MGCLGKALVWTVVICVILAVGLPVLFVTLIFLMALVLVVVSL